MPRLSLLCLLCLAGLQLAAQGITASYPYRLHREPSLFVTGIVETPEGALWVASKQGLFRYDGFHFESHPLPNLVVPQELAATADGRLWVGSEDGLFTLEAGKWKTIVRGIARQVTALGQSVLFRSHDGVYRVDGSGQRRRIDICGDGARLRPILKGKGQDLYLITDRRDQLCRIPLDGSPTLVALPGDWDSGVLDYRGSLWLEDRFHNLYRRTSLDTPGVKQATPPYRDLYQGRLLSDTRGAAWFLGNPTVNLTDGDILDRGREHRRPTHLADGLRNNLWLAERQLGLVEFHRGYRWEQWTSHQLGASVFQLHQRASGEILISSSNGVWLYDGKQLKVVRERFGAARPILELTDGRWVGILPNAGLQVFSSNGKVQGSVEMPFPRGDWPKLYRQPVQDRSGQVWLPADTVLLRFPVEGKAFQAQHIPILLEEDGLGASDIEVDAIGRLWVGHARGLSYQENDRWVALETDPVLRDVRQFELANNDIWVARKAPGPFARLRRQGSRWLVEDFKPQDGFGPSRTIWLRVDSRGWIWRGVPGGVRVSDGKNLKDWLYLRESNGLDIGEPSPKGFAEGQDGSIWIAGDKGVAHFMPQASWFNVPDGAPPPLISSAAVHGRHLRARIGGLQMPEFREKPLEYRLLPHFEDWRGTTDGALEFPDLRDNDYQLEVRYAGMGLSPVARRVIQVGQGASHFPWGRLGGAALGLGVAWVTVRKTALYRKAAYQLEKRLFLMRPEPPEELDREAVVDERFQILRPIARGGFSIVYEATDLKTNARLALKTMGPRSQDESWVRNRFSHEQNALRAISHPHVVSLVDAGVGSNGLLYLAMPFLDGPSLRERLQAGALNPHLVVTMARQLAGALEAAHRKGIVHLDFKPENVILAPAGAVLIDFGTSGLRSSADELAITRLVSGSAFYMAPERLTGHYSTASDVYAFGSVVQEMLTGKRLSDYSVPSFHSAFLPEFAAALKAVAGGQAMILADCLARSFDVEPRRRPTKLSEWVESWSAIVTGDHVP